MQKIHIAGDPEQHNELSRIAIRAEIIRFAELLASQGIGSVRVWCSWNPDLPEDSPLQSPNKILPPSDILDFFDTLVRDGAWVYGDSFGRAGIDAIDGSFTFFLNNDRGITLETDDPNLLDAIRTAWLSAGYTFW